MTAPGPWVAAGDHGRTVRVEHRDDGGLVLGIETTGGAHAAELSPEQAEELREWLAPLQEARERGAI